MRRAITKDGCHLIITPMESNNYVIIAESNNRKDGCHLIITSMTSTMTYSTSNTETNIFLLSLDIPIGSSIIVRQLISWRFPS